MVDYRIRVTACCGLALWLFSAATGCDVGPRPLSGPVAVVKSHDRGLSTDEAAIIVILGKQFGKQPDEIQSSNSLKDLGADELDLVEVVMELEEEFQISIPDGAVQKAAGEATMDNMLKRLTPPKLAALVEEARHWPK
jgi:acyl carrier protein